MQTMTVLLIRLSNRKFILFIFITICLVYKRVLKRNKINTSRSQHKSFIKLNQKRSSKLLTCYCTSLNSTILSI